MQVRVIVWIRPPAQNLSEKEMLKTIVWLALLVVLGYLFICLFMYFRQRAMLYYPTAPVNSSEAQPIWLEHDGERLKIWYAAGSGRRALIYFGGNAEEVSHNIGQLKRLFPSYHLYLHNYRGYGGSSGTPGERELLADSLALYERIRARHEEVVVIGRSLGTGVALYLASQKPLLGLVLVTPYASMVEVAAHHYPYLPVRSLMKDRFDSASRATMVAAPVLCLVAEVDEVIPRKISDALVQSFPPDQVREVVIEKASHNTISEFTDYERQLFEFVDGLSGQ
jgi:pimeloyl-ACP methyl ester carboxylesterase